MDPAINDQSIYFESRPERRVGRPVPEAVTARRDVVADALANLSTAVSAEIGQTAEELPAQIDNRRLAEVIQNSQRPRQNADDTQSEVHGGPGSGLSELRRQVAAAYPSDVYRGEDY